MATPIVEHIAAEIADLIDAITVAAGFHQDLTAIRPKRLHLESDVNADGNVVIEQLDADIEAESTTTIIWRQGFTIQALVIDSDEATAAIDTRLNQVRSDIEKQLMSGGNCNLGGYGRLMLTSAERFIPDPQTAVIAVNVDVLYEVQIDDPYTQG
jgi:hypothetical protein